MSISNKLKELNLPNFDTLIKITRSAKTKIDNVNTNVVQVNFFYADNKFKTSVEGEILHITDIPICVINYPSKLAYLILDESMVYDLKNQRFEIYVNEKYTHALEVNLQHDSFGEIKKLIIPKIPKNFEYRLVEMDPPTSSIDRSKILLTASMLKSLGLGKLLERTQEQDNDGLIIISLLSLMVGVVLGFIICLALVGVGGA